MHAGQDAATEQDRGADAGYFGRDSVSWRVHADPMMLVGGVRALFLQALHPQAMAAVAQYSHFRDDPWRRLLRTADYIGVTTYGTKVEADAAAQRLRRLHAKVPGAKDPELLRWIHCCEIESFLTTIRRAGLPLADADADAYVAEQVASAALVGLAADDVPHDTASLQRYFDDIRPDLALIPPAREAARYLLFPPMTGWVQVLTPARPGWAAIAVLGFSLLPRWARRMYRMPGLPTTDVAATASARAMRASLLLVPERLRTGPRLRAALDRIGAA
jgi:uncharacterized protein (DUF2236 family)